MERLHFTNKQVSFFIQIFFTKEDILSKATWYITLHYEPSYLQHVIHGRIQTLAVFFLLFLLLLTEDTILHYSHIFRFSCLSAKPSGKS